MAFVLRGPGLRRGVSVIRPTWLGMTRWHTPDDRNFSSEGPKAPDDKQDRPTPKDKDKLKQEEARSKLNSLLESIEKQRTVAPSAADRAGQGVSERLARPGGRPRPKNVVPNKKRAPTAAAESGGAPHRPQRQPTLDEQVAAAAREVASTLSGDPAQTERDLLTKLTGDPEQPAAGQAQLSELMSGMKVDQRPAEADRPGRSQQVRRQVGDQRAETVRQARRERPPAAPRQGGSVIDDVDLNKGNRLGIFDNLPPPEASTEVAPQASHWERIHARELRLSVAHPPTNAWEEMVVWTEQGKLWHLPVNNEQGLDQEAEVGFHEHVFLEERLEPWCPPRGPIRQFMELVCVALGKNPWLTVQEKHEHIEWFREYFAGKQKLLQELKAV
ncbi:28S ribosomal protein S31, mitochondrial-like [Amphibalanus amphitrite]|uniref:28S ribosomal protein S31, mitochondrial-like n=1 Tax=Amphibalanus amphitrite TaxID=1232801 RepID=UPI001C9096A3|nr:28S ribosomal protein S31, mitochondrial-like [Amphibalanus amphitrite]